jgi:hypothetical protein
MNNRVKVPGRPRRVVRDRKSRAADKEKLSGLGSGLAAVSNEVVAVGLFK